MKQVSEREFLEFIEKHKAIPDGFRSNGAFIQTRFFANNVEVARRSQDTRGTIWEICEEDEP